MIRDPSAGGDAAGHVLRCGEGGVDLAGSIADHVRRIPAAALHELLPAAGLHGPHAAGGALSTMTMLGPVMMMNSINPMGQMSAEFITGAAPTPTSQVMLAGHVWGMPGMLGGIECTPSGSTSSPTRTSSCLTRRR